MRKTTLSHLLVEKPGILVGSAVRAQDGSYLGDVISLALEGLQLQKGILNIEYFYMEYAEITSAFGHSIYTWRGQEALIPLPEKVSLSDLDRTARHQQAHSASQTSLKDSRAA